MRKEIALLISMFFITALIFGFLAYYGMTETPYNEKIFIDNEKIYEYDDDNGELIYNGTTYNDIQGFGYENDRLYFTRSNEERLSGCFIIGLMMCIGFSILTIVGVVVLIK